MVRWKLNDKSNRQKKKKKKIRSPHSNGEHNPNAQDIHIIILTKSLSHDKYAIVIH